MYVVQVSGHPMHISVQNLELSRHKYMYVYLFSVEVLTKFLQS